MKKTDGSLQIHNFPFTTKWTISWRLVLVRNDQKYTFHNIVFSRPVKEGVHHSSRNSVGNFFILEYMIVIDMDDDDQCVPWAAS